MPIQLLFLLGIPLAGAVIAALLGPKRPDAVRWISLLATLAGLALAIDVAVHYRPPESPSHTFQPQFVTAWQLLPLGTGGVQFYIGIDGLNLWLILLTNVLMVSSVLVSWTSITDRVHEFHAWLLALGCTMLGVFLAFDVILFYVFFELTLVPLFFLIGIWGGPQRQHAARKFFIYTLAGSLITFLGVLAIIIVCHGYTEIWTFSIPGLVEQVQEVQKKVAGKAEDLAAWRAVQGWIFLAMALGFAIKVPLVPLHTWLPLAHVEAPTAGSVLLAGVLLKIGAYGFLRLCLPLVPDASVSLGVPLITVLAVAGIIYGACCALAQDDIKKLVAYSSVSHLGFCMLGLFALNLEGLSGGLLQMINHGLSTGALFLLVGMLYERYHTRKMADYGGMGAKLGLLTVFMVFICLTSVGLPGLNGFVGEALVLLGSFQKQPWLTAVAASGIVLGAWYLLTMLRRVFFGPVKEPHHEGDGPVADLNLRELAALVPIAVLCIALGVYPQPVLNRSQPDLDVVAKITANAKNRLTQAENEQPQARLGEDAE